MCAFKPIILLVAENMQLASNCRNIVMLIDSRLQRKKQNIMPNAARKICLNIYSYYDTFLRNSGRQYHQNTEHHYSTCVFVSPFVCTHRWIGKNMQVFNSIFDRAKSSALWKIQIHARTCAPTEAFHIVCDQNFSHFRFHSSSAHFIQCKDMLDHDARCENAN